MKAGKILNSMTNHTNLIDVNKAQEKIRTVKVNERGQFVIPEDMRKDLGIEANTVLVLVARDNEIILRREKDILDDLGTFWKKAGHRALQRGWDDHDDAWDEHAEKETT